MKIMSQLRQSKKGTTDHMFFFMYLFIFLTLGILLPYINSEFSSSSTEFNTDGIDDVVGDETNFSTISGFALIASIFKMFFWTFGDLPFWLDAIFLVFRIHFGVLIYRLIRGF